MLFVWFWFYDTENRSKWHKNIILTKWCYLFHRYGKHLGGLWRRLECFPQFLCFFYCFKVTSWLGLRAFILSFTRKWQTTQIFFTSVYSRLGHKSMGFCHHATVIPQTRVLIKLVHVRSCIICFGVHRPKGYYHFVPGIPL